MNRTPLRCAAPWRRATSSSSCATWRGGRGFPDSGPAARHGDIQLTIVQTAELDGVVVVTTPQEVALIDARKAIGLFERVKTPILGVIENMSYFQCPSDGKIYHIFGEGGGERKRPNWACRCWARFRWTSPPARRGRRSPRSAGRPGAESGFRGIPPGGRALRPSGAEPLNARTGQEAPDRFIIFVESGRSLHFRPDLSAGMPGTWKENDFL
ncbi:MAG: P-loop NTPase [Akkermansia sp.]